MSTGQVRFVFADAPEHDRKNESDAGKVCELRQMHQHVPGVFTNSEQLFVTLDVDSLRTPGQHALFDFAKFLVCECALRALLFRTTDFIGDGQIDTPE